MRECSIEWCKSRPVAHGWCNRHYLRFRKHGDPVAVGHSCTSDAEAKFRESVRITETDECIEWSLTRHKKGYGVFYIGASGSGRSFLAHRFSFEMHNRPLADGEHVRHKCDNPPCVNPRHLLAGSNADNIADKVERGRQPRGEATAIAVLREPEVLEIRAKWGSGSRVSDLARDYGVSPSTVSAVVNRRSWRHI